MDWWDLYHRLMGEVPWASPRAIGELTLKQIECLAFEGAGGRRALAGPDQYARAYQDALRRRDSWE